MEHSANSEQHAEIKPAFKIGVVLVHGIGKSKSGDTVRSWGSPLFEILASKDAHRKVSYDKPASLEFSAKGKEIRITESCWGELFTAPSFLELCKWSLHSLPTTLISHFDERFRRITNYVEKRSENGTILPSIALLLELFALLFGLLLIPAIIIFLVILIFLSIVPQFREFSKTVQTILTATAGDSLVFSEDGFDRVDIIDNVKSDIEKARKSCVKCVVIAHSQGAAIAHAAIRQLKDDGGDMPDIFISFGSGLRKLKQLRRYLNEEYKNKNIRWGVAVIATASFAGIIVVLEGWQSNGTPIIAALALTVCAMVICLSGLVFRTIGYQLSRNWKTPTVCISRLFNWLGIFFIAIASYFLYPYLLAFPDFFSPNLDTNFWVACTISLGLAFTLLMEWRYALDRETSERCQRIKEGTLWREEYKLPGVHWVDIYASFDPVPNGPLMDYYEPKNYHPIQFDNKLSPLKDHTDYFPKNSWFLNMVASVVMAEPPLPVTKNRPLHGTSKLEIIYRLLTFASIVFWFWLVFDTEVSRLVEETQLFKSFTEQSIPIMQNGSPTNNYIEKGWLNRRWDFAQLFVLLSFIFLAPIWFALYLIRRFFIWILPPNERIIKNK